MTFYLLYGSFHCGIPSEQYIHYLINCQGRTTGHVGFFEEMASNKGVAYYAGPSGYGYRQSMLRLSQPIWSLQNLN